MRSTYGNKLGGIPRSNVPVPANEKRYSPILKQNGTRDELIDWQLYFKKEEEGGLLPEYKNSDIREILGLKEMNENGEFGYGDIVYAFRDIRLVPLHDELNNRITEQVAGYTIPGTWYLVADLYLYLKRDVVIESQGQAVINEKVSGIIESDILLAVGQLDYALKPCNNGATNYVDWYYKFSTDEIESLGNINIKQKSKNSGNSVSIRERLLQKVKRNDGIINSVVPLAKRGTVPKGHGVLPISGEYSNVNTGEVVTWDGFTLDRNNQIPVKIPGLGTISVEQDKSITQNIVWQTIWKAWSGSDYDNITIDMNDPRLDDDSSRYDGALLPLEADGFPINSEFAEGYYVPRGTKWLRVSKKLMDGAFPNICRGKSGCGEKLSNDDCTKVKFTLVDAKRRIDEEKYKFISKDTSKYYPIPGKPCYQGLPATYERTSIYEYTSSKECFDGKIDQNGNLYGERKQLFNYTTKTEVETVIEWENIIRNSIDAVCECYELSVQNPPCIDPNDPYNCNILYTDTIYTICPDDGLYYYKNREIPPDAVPTRLEIRAISDHECHNDTVISTYYPLRMDKDILRSMPIMFTDGGFNSEATMSSCFTSSLQSENSRQYYTDVMAFDESTNDIQFSLIYANKLGLGSTVFGNRETDTPSKANYTQYLHMVSDDGQNNLKFYTNGSIIENQNDFYVINFNNKTIKDRIDVGNFQMSLMDLNDETHHITLIDNSGDLVNNKYYTDSPYFSFSMVSGSLSDGIHSSGEGNAKTNTNFTTYGEIYPNLGLIILDSTKLNSELNFTTVTSSNTFAKNELNLFESISGSMSNGNSMYLRNSVRRVSTHFFARVPHTEANYTNNPTFSNTKTDGVIVNKRFGNDPVTYVTTVGLYNDNNELLALGKLSKPMKKTRENELLLEIKLTI
jgi:hypothetical protein